MAEFDIEAGHRHFSAGCFNATWALIDKKDRSAEEDERMLACAAASYWHWLERPDVDHEKRSIGLWLLARVHALVDDGEVAHRYARRSLAEAEAGNLEPFYVGYACEALARASIVMSDKAGAEVWKGKAMALLDSIANEEWRGWLRADLEGIGSD